MKNISEIKFVEWSRNIKASNYDVLAVSEILANTFHSRQICGLDVGGGIGAFSSMICETVDNCEITIIDNSQAAKENFLSHEKINIEFVDFFSFSEHKKYDFIILKTVLHHFIASSDAETENCQINGLQKCINLLKKDGIILVEENFYEPYLGRDLTGRLIYTITKIKALEKLTRKLGANTAGEGVRFRSFRAWKDIIETLGLQIESCVQSSSWGQRFPLWQRIPLFCKTRYQAVLVLNNKADSN